MRYVCNVITIAMAPTGGVFTFREIVPSRARQLLTEVPICQAVGHAETAAMANESLGEEVVKMNRTSVKLTPGDDLVIIQYTGPRLPEGCIHLPPGASLGWYYVTYKELPVVTLPPVSQ